ncbi:Glutamate receptor-interacting protein 1 [Strongyloides ratti]|uniref:Glutamate receptor-interacting protein 1 n=1 Tax=Strongyloides ratti TaxID=34506 RepID=A0A090N0T7_STRRB|nr:Glutamate receptor-interacting protein 1 [Strongyloides ratti]CEF71258.1 Glutamate receptor-interacting protein 1 [Strongyloides ratti]
MSSSTSFFDFESSSSEDETVTSLKVNISREDSINNLPINGGQEKENTSIDNNDNLSKNSSIHEIPQIDNKIVKTNMFKKNFIEEKFNNQLLKYFIEMPNITTTTTTTTTTSSINNNKNTIISTYEGKSKSTNVLSILSQPDDIEKMVLSNNDIIKNNKKNLSIPLLPGSNGESFIEDSIIEKECHSNSRRLQIYNCYEIASAMNLNDYNKKNGFHLPIGSNKIKAEEVKECKKNENKNIYSKLDNIISGFNMNKMLTQSLFLPTSKDGFSLNDLTEKNLLPNKDYIKNQNNIHINCKKGEYFLKNSRYLGNLERAGLTLCQEKYNPIYSPFVFTSTQDDTYTLSPLIELEKQIKILENNSFNGCVETFNNSNDDLSFFPPTSGTQEMPGPTSYHRDGTKFYSSLTNLEFYKNNSNNNHYDGERGNLNKRNLGNSLSGSYIAKLTRTSDLHLGLGITGGADRALSPIISYIRPGFVAHRSDQLRVGEKLLAVDGKEVNDLTHGEILTLIRTCGDTIMLEISYDLNDPIFERNPNALNKCTEISLTKESNSFGLTLRGGSYGPDPKKARPITIVAVRPGSSAHIHGRLFVRDRILSVNGIDVFSCNLHTAYKILQESGDNVTLTIEYDVTICESRKYATGPMFVDLNKNSCCADLGIKLAICTEEEYERHIYGNTYSILMASDKNSPLSPTVKKKGTKTENNNNSSSTSLNSMKRKLIFIKEIIPASIADRSGALEVGDRILAIDDIQLEHTTLAEAEQLLKGQGETIRITFIPNHLLLKNKKDTKRMFTKKKENDYSDNNSFLLKSRHSFYQRSAKSKKKMNNNINEFQKNTLTTSIPSNSSIIGEARIVPINNFGNLSYSSKDIYNETNIKPQLKFVSSSDLMENNKMYHGNGRISLRDSQAQINNSTSRAKSFDRSYLITNPSLYDQSYNNNNNNFKATKLSINNRIAGIATVSSINGCFSGIPTTKVCHVETQKVTLIAPLASTALYKGYGISLHKYDMETSFTDDQTGIGEHLGAIYISNIEKNSPADKCERLQIGDRVLAINDWYTMNGTIEEANHIIKNTKGSITLLVEFDVIESPLSLSGMLSVKLTKRGNGVGIICKTRDEYDGKKGEPLIVDDIVQGSPAYRCGSIHIGDRIVSIDDIPLSTCTVSEGIRLLHRCGDVIHLLIQKNHHINDKQKQENNCRYIYDIALNRRGNPLGITIASNGETGEPIVITQIARGGVAEVTNTLHPGDQIIAINGESVEGMNVRNAMRILQLSKETVHLRIVSKHPKHAVNVQLVDKQNFNYSNNNNNNNNNCVISSLSGGEDPTSLMYTSLPPTSLSNYTNYLSNSQGGTSHNDTGSERSDKVGTPIQSIDSAVESLDDSPDSNGKRVNNTNYSSQHHNDNGYTSNKLQLQSLSSVLNNSTVVNNKKDTIEYDGSQIPPMLNLDAKRQSSYMRKLYNTNEDIIIKTPISLPDNTPKKECCNCSEKKKNTQKADKNNPYWMDILEALETSGEEEMLKKLEETILSGNIDEPDKNYQNNIYVAKQNTNCITTNNSITSINQPIGILKKPHIKRDNNTSNYGITTTYSSQHSPSSSSNNSHEKTPIPNLGLVNLCDEISCYSKQQDTSKNLVFKSSELVQTTIHNIRLERDPISNSFGFSVSDGVGENPGIFVSQIKKGSPADAPGALKPFDKIIKINNSHVGYLDCDLALPLLAMEVLELVIQRDTPVEHCDDESCKSPISCIKDSSV